MVEPFELGSRTIEAGSRELLELPVARLPTGSMLALPVTVLHGVRPGPVVGLSAALHGDELNGLEIIRRVLLKLDPLDLAGTVVAVPIVNVFGFIHQTRYLPDRRDLNRSFPGSPKGSLASRLAHQFLNQVVARCQYGLDFHTGSRHRTNLAQIRTDLRDPELRRLAEAFAAPLRFRAPTIRGSLRAEAGKLGVKLLLFEGGEPMRFNRRAIRSGVRGSLRALAALGLWPGEPPPIDGEAVELDKTSWLRAARSGVFYLDVALGERVARRQIVGIVADPITGSERPIRAPWPGVVVGHTNNPLVYRGDAVVHLGRVTGSAAPERR